MKLSIISGSHRKNSESARISTYINNESAKAGFSSSEVISLAENPLPLWDEGVWSQDEKWSKLWSPISAKLAQADAFVVVAPEWGGMVPAGLKNLFLLCGANELAHKPALIVAVSSGIGGSYPVNELRTSSYKNSRICYIPDHLIVRNSAAMLKGEKGADTHDESLRKRITYSLDILKLYATGLKLVRESGKLDYKSFPFGM